MSQQSFDLNDDDNLDDILANIDKLEDDPKLWPKMLHDLICVTESHIKNKRPHLNDDAHKLARDVVISISHYLGGRQLYLPRDDRLQRALRDHKIYQEFSGNNQQELAFKYDLTSIQIYNIIAHQRKLHHARVQPCLFE